LSEVKQQKESYLRECNELKTQLKMVEDMRDCVRRELMDTNRRCREQHEEIELKRKDINELKRSMNDELREKESVATSNDELRAKLKISENEKTDVSRLLEEAKQKISGNLVHTRNIRVDSKLSFHFESQSLGRTEECNS
jgi:rootletin